MSDQSITLYSQINSPVLENMESVLPPSRGWQPYKLPELATVGFPFSPSFIVRPCMNQPSVKLEESELPFGFRFRTHKEASERPTIDLTKGYYDPYTQLYTVSQRDGGDTAGPTFKTGYWTEKDGSESGGGREWDEVDDQESD